MAKLASEDPFLPIRQIRHPQAVRRPQLIESVRPEVTTRTRLTRVRVKDAVGRYGEQVAADHLTNAGLRILERNWRCAGGEIDIIAMDGPVLAIIEVKTRSSNCFGDPAEAVNAAKSTRIRRLAVLWLADRRVAGQPESYPEMRFDVVSVLRNAGHGPLVNHLKGAF